VSTPRQPAASRDANAVSPRHRGAAALLAATVVNLPFGTLYAFSMFLGPMEACSVPRARGFVFGLATVTLTVGMNVAPQLYRRLAPATLALGSGLTSGLALVPRRRRALRSSRSATGCCSGPARACCSSWRSRR